jgi:hypothetical protein
VDNKREYVYLVAGTYEQAKDYIIEHQNTGWAHVKYVYVNDHRDLTGIAGPIHGKFIGTFKERSDYSLLLHQLLVKNIGHDSVSVLQLLIEQAKKERAEIE